MTVIGTIAVGLTYVAGKRAHDARTGLMAAALLALNGLHIAWSQVVRTDIHASVFMLLSLIFAMRIVEEGRWRDYLLAGLFAGFAIATKWPAASVFAAVIGASAGRIFNRRGSLAQEAVRLPSAGLMLIAGMLIASPYLLLDWRTVVSDLTGEGRPFHLGHTGSGFLANLWWYLRFHVAGSMGWLGLGLAVAGTVITARRPGPARWTTLPAAAAFLVIISAQNLIWSRWVLPVLPMLCILAAVAVVAIIQKVQPLLSPAARPAVAALLVGTALIPSLIGARNQAVERSNDTRAQAAAWAVANIPPGSTLVLEHLELKLRTQPWRFLFPIGEGGCLDGLKLLEKKVGYDEVKQKRKGSNIVDLGNVAPNRIDSCRADYAILVYYDLYLLEAARFPMQIDVYRKVLAGGRTVALFRPKPGVAGGPTVRVFAIPRR
jgi:4-amino-4-deoxy-L-arabinose transferase-like glycosyltransferase